MIFGRAVISLLDVRWRSKTFERAKLSTPRIHNVSHVHRVNPITRLNGVKHAPQPAPRMTFTHDRASAYGDPVSTSISSCFFSLIPQSGYALVTLTSTPSNIVPRPLVIPTEKRSNNSLRIVWKLYYFGELSSRHTLLHSGVPRTTNIEVLSILVYSF